MMFVDLTLGRRVIEWLKDYTWQEWHFKQVEYFVG